MPETRQKRIFQLKITIVGTKPPIWRRIEIPKGATLALLHKTIQVAFGWDDCHLHEFEVFGSSYGVPHPNDAGFGRKIHNETKAKLGNLVYQRAKFDYIYDFGDNWTHAITVEKELDSMPGVAYPRCTAAKRACPPEDCGGVWGYENILDAIANPGDERYEELIEWVGEDFDPDYVDLTTTNTRLERLAIG